MSGISYNLLCLLEEEREPFHVASPSDILIPQLKKRIKAARENTLQRVDASKLILWKVHYILVICSDIMGSLYP